MEGVSTAKRALAVLLTAVLALGTVLLATGCSSNSGESSSNSDPITVVFLPDNSSADMEASRDAVAEIIKNATGRDVEMVLKVTYRQTKRTIKFSAPLPQAMQMAHSMKPATTAASA